MIRATALLADHEVSLSDECLGTAQCVNIAPDVFVLDHEGRATFVREPAIESLEDVLIAEAVCPMAAISVTPA